MSTKANDEARPGKGKGLVIKALLVKVLIYQPMKVEQNSILDLLLEVFEPKVMNNPLILLMIIRLELQA